MSENGRRDYGRRDYGRRDYGRRPIDGLVRTNDCPEFVATRP